MKWSGVLLGFTALCLLIHGGSASQMDQSSLPLRNRETQSVQEAELSRASTSFGWALYDQLASKDNTNIIFSPFSIFTALSMTLQGTAGNTKKQLEEVLELGPSLKVHTALQDTMESFPISPDANVTLRMANAVYYNDKKVTILEEFNNSMSSTYGAVPRPFEQPKPEKPINEWVLEQTGGKIKDFLPEDTITPDIVLILLNAIYFQGTWKDVFNKTFTKDRKFTKASGQEVQVAMMRREGYYSVKTLPPELKARMLELPFGNDGRFSMFVLLPDEADGLANLEDHLNATDLDDSMNNMPSTLLYEVMMPKFTLKISTSFLPILEALGLTDIFGPKADLSRMAAAPLFVDDILHEALIEVDETGAKAAATTAVKMSLKSTRLPPPVFKMDHPFLFVLRDKKARLNLFMGRLHDPQENAA